MIILDFMETVSKWGDQLKTWLSEAFKNPLFLLVFFGAGILLFKVVYDALNKQR